MQQSYLILTPSQDKKVEDFFHELNRITDYIPSKYIRNQLSKIVQDESQLQKIIRDLQKGGTLKDNPHWNHFLIRYKAKQTDKDLLSRLKLYIDQLKYLWGGEKRKKTGLLKLNLPKLKHLEKNPKKTYKELRNIAFTQPTLKIGVSPPILINQNEPTITFSHKTSSKEKQLAENTVKKWRQFVKKRKEPRISIKRQSSHSTTSFPLATKTSQLKSRQKELRQMLETHLKEIDNMLVQLTQTVRTKDVKIMEEVIQSTTQNYQSLVKEIKKFMPHHDLSSSFSSKLEELKKGINLATKIRKKELKVIENANLIKSEYDAISREIDQLLRQTPRPLVKIRDKINLTKEVLRNYEKSKPPLRNLIRGQKTKLEQKIKGVESLLIEQEQRQLMQKQEQRTKKVQKAIQITNNYKEKLALLRSKLEQKPLNILQLQQIIHSGNELVEATQQGKKEFQNYRQLLQGIQTQKINLAKKLGQASQKVTTQKQRLKKIQQARTLLSQSSKDQEGSMKLYKLYLEFYDKSDQIDGSFFRKLKNYFEGINAKYSNGKGTLDMLINYLFNFTQNMKKPDYWFIFEGLLSDEKNILFKILIENQSYTQFLLILLIDNFFKDFLKQSSQKQQNFMKFFNSNDASILLPLLKVFLKNYNENLLEFWNEIFGNFKNENISILEAFESESSSSNLILNMKNIINGLNRTEKNTLKTIMSDDNYSRFRNMIK